MHAEFNAPSPPSAAYALLQTVYTPKRKALGICILGLRIHIVSGVLSESHLGMKVPCVLVILPCLTHALSAFNIGKCLIWRLGSESPN